MNYTTVQKTQKADGNFFTKKPVAIKHVDRVQNIIHTRLKIGARNDQYEQEADRVAERIIRLPVSADVHDKSDGVSKAATGKCINSNGSVKDEALRRKPSGNGEAIVSYPLSARINSTRGNGVRLNASTKGFMERGLGRDFSGVRIHTDNQAVNLSRELNAHAFTVGNDIYFDRNKYSPESNSGKRLLAHELVHTLHQQNESTTEEVIQRSFNPGRCCNSSITGDDEWALVSGKEEGSPTVWQRLSVGECAGNSGIFEEGVDCEGMTCGGGFYVVQGWTSLLAPGTCRTPGNDDFFYEDNRWTPTNTTRADAQSPINRGSGEGNTPPGYRYYEIESS